MILYIAASGSVFPLYSPNQWLAASAIQTVRILASSSHILIRSLWRNWPAHHFSGWHSKKRGLGISALLFVQQLIPVDNVVPDQIHIDSVRPCRILAATAGYVVPSLELPIQLGLNLLGGHLFRWNVFRHSHTSFISFDCCSCLQAM